MLAAVQPVWFQGRGFCCRVLRRLLGSKISCLKECFQVASPTTIESLLQRRSRWCSLAEAIHVLTSVESTRPSLIRRWRARRLPDSHPDRRIAHPRHARSIETSCSDLLLRRLLTSYIQPFHYPFALQFESQLKPVELFPRKLPNFPFSKHR